MICETKGTDNIKLLFGDWQESLIWSCIQGVMGYLFADDYENPRSAMAVIGDFCFFAGEPCAELVSYRVDRNKNFIIMTARNPGWFELIERTFGDNAKKVTRYAIKKEQGVFDEKKLKDIARSLPQEFSLRSIDEDIFNRCKKEDWCKDFVSLFSDYSEYQRIGLGVVAIKDNIIVSGASSYSSYQEGIEIEIDTRPDYRRRGLALACSAKLILECLGRGLYPSWDAQNLWSVAIAEKLGYHFDHEYIAYEISNYKQEGTEIKYKKLTEKELDTFIQMRIRQLREEGASEDIDLVPALQDYYTRHMADGTFVSWLAMDGEKIVGTSGMSFVEKPPYFGCPSGKIGLLSSMFTDKDYRRKGIAKELLTRVVGEARAYGCGTVQITASDMGVFLYTDFGFIKNGNFMQYKLA